MIIKHTICRVIWTLGTKLPWFPALQNLYYYLLFREVSAILQEMTGFGMTVPFLMHISLMTLHVLSQSFQHELSFQSHLLRVLIASQWRAAIRIPHHQVYPFTLFRIKADQRLRMYTCHSKSIYDYYQAILLSH